MDYKLLLNEVDSDIKSRLSEKRYLHSIGVMKEMEKLAIRFNVNIDEAKIVGLAHDIAKEMPKEEREEYIKDNNLLLDEMEKNIGSLSHAKIGADICEKKYAFTKEMKEAVENHTLGNVNMSDLSKMLIVADKTEETRTYPDIEYVRKLSEGDLDKTVMYILEVGVQKQEEKGKRVHPMTKNAIEFLKINK